MRYPHLRPPNWFEKNQPETASVLPFRVSQIFFLFDFNQRRFHVGNGNSGGGGEFSPPTGTDSRIVIFLSQKPLPKCHPQQSQSAAHFCQCCLSINSMRHPTKLGKWGLETGCKMGTDNSNDSLVFNNLFLKIPSIATVVIILSTGILVTEDPRFTPSWNLGVWLENPSGAYYSTPWSNPSKLCPHRQAKLGPHR